MEPSQHFTQKFLEEEQLFSESIKECIADVDAEFEEELKKKMVERRAQRTENLKEKKAEETRKKKLGKSLGPRYTILLRHQEKLEELFDQRNLLKPCVLAKELSGSKFRHFLVREVFSPNYPNTEEMVELWHQIYVGDFQHGVSAKRKDAEDKGWPKKSIIPKNDRNSWIARCLRSCLRLKGVKGLTSD